MPWQILTVVVDRSAHTQVEAVLEQAGALAITTEDAGDEPVLEPGIGETPLWPQLRITGLFNPGDDRRRITEQLSDLDSVDQAEQLNWQVIEDQDWTRVWMDRFQPMDFGHGLWIVPGGQARPEAAEHVIELDPGLAFGTGTHPTTALCLRWLAARHSSVQGARVLDYGCGSGILGIAAARLGAEHVVAVDHDPQALVATLANARVNRLQHGIRTLSADDYSEDDLSGGFDLVLANILAEPLVALAPRLLSALRPGGELVLSGILVAQADTVRAAYADAVDLDLHIEDGWVCLSGKRE